MHVPSPLWENSPYVTSIMMGKVRNMKTFLLLFLSFFVFVSHDVVAEKTSEEHIKTEIIRWEKVNKILPKYSKFTVRDVLTGKEFSVQRRAGSRHADVQPLTTKDTKIMKEIYGGKWSWKRRAIIVIHDKKRVAASMHGMPHGAGALQNNFPGHFCIHFYGSTTHRRNEMDLSHKLMILKAADKLEQHLQRANPYELVSAFIAGIKEDDEWIMDQTTIQDVDWSKTLHLVENVAIVSMPMLPDEDIGDQLTFTIPIEIDWHIKDKGRERTKGEITLIRFLPYGMWKVDAKEFMESHLHS